MSKKAEMMDTAAFDLDDLDAADESEMTVIANGNPTGWVWRFAGPGHSKTIAQSNRIARERLAIEKQQEQTRVNGKRWKAPDESPEELIDRNVNLIVERLLGWSPVTMAGKPFEFSPANASALLKDPRKGALLMQALEFLGDETAFTRRSENS